MRVVTRESPEKPLMGRAEERRGGRSWEELSEMVATSESRTSQLVRSQALLIPAFHHSTAGPTLPPI